MINSTIKDLVNYCSQSDFKGYDPYDTLNSYINFRIFGTLISSIAIQFQKRNPINIRPLLGIKKGYNPKASGLFLKAFCILYQKTKQEEYLVMAKWHFNWLRNNCSRGYSGYAWGYNFDWASPGSYLEAYTPSVVVTSFAIDGIFEYYKITKDAQAKQIIVSAANYIINDIPITTFEKGIAFSYTHKQRDCCYNASMLAAEILAKADYVNNKGIHQQIINDAVNFVISKQHSQGEWWYSLDLNSNEERHQIDFHQGFLLVSLSNLQTLLQKPVFGIHEALQKGLKYYKEEQFLENGQSLWRVPNKWPIEIHNQSQGIITFKRLKEYDPHYLKFAIQIAEWTLKHMKSNRGYFYYKKTRLFLNKIPYMRWSQAWMLLALAELLNEEE